MHQIQGLIEKLEIQIIKQIKLVYQKKSERKFQEDLVSKAGKQKAEVAQESPEVENRVQKYLVLDCRVQLYQAIEYLLHFYIVLECRILNTSVQYCWNLVYSLLSTSEHNIDNQKIL